MFSHVQELELKANELFSARRVRLFLLNVTCQSSVVWESWSLSGIDQIRTHRTFRCHNLITGNTPQKIHFPFFFLKVKFWRVVRTFLTTSQQPLDQFGWNLAGLLPDSFATKQSLWILIPHFVLKIDLFPTRGANLFVSLTSSANKRRTNALAKNQRHGFFIQRCQEENAVLIVLFSLFLEGVKPNLWRMKTCMC